MEGNDSSRVNGFESLRELLRLLKTLWKYRGCRDVALPRKPRKLVAAAQWSSKATIHTTKSGYRTVRVHGGDALNSSCYQDSFSPRGLWTMCNRKFYKSFGVDCPVPLSISYVTSENFNYAKGSNFCKLFHVISPGLDIPFLVLKNENWKNSHVGLVYVIVYIWDHIWDHCSMLQEISGMMSIDKLIM